MRHQGALKNYPRQAHPRLALWLAPFALALLVLAGAGVAAAQDREAAAPPPANDSEAAGTEPTKPPLAADAGDAAQPKTVVVSQPARLLYDVTAQVRGGNYHANAELRFEHDTKKYEAHFEIRALSLVLRSQTSSGRLGPEGLIPVRFVDTTRSERVATFDWDHHRIRFSGDLADQPLEPLAQDRLSVILQLSAMFAGDAATFTPDGNFAIQTVGTTHADTWNFTVKGEETVRFAGAQVRALKLERIAREKGDQSVEIWLAPLLGHLPVRLKIAQIGGDYLDLRLSAVEKP